MENLVRLQTDLYLKQRTLDCITLGLDLRTNVMIEKRHNEHNSANDKTHDTAGSSCQTVPHKHECNAEVA